MGEVVRIPKNMLDELEALRRYARVEVLDTPTLRYLAMGRHKFEHAIRSVPSAVGSDSLRRCFSYAAGRIFIRYHTALGVGAGV
jgi:hypothetical protein